MVLPETKWEIYQKALNYKNTFHKTFLSHGSLLVNCDSWLEKIKSRHLIWKKKHKMSQFLREQHFLSLTKKNALLTLHISTYAVRTCLPWEQSDVVTASIYCQWLENTLNPLLQKVIGYPNYKFQIPSCHCLTTPSAFQLSHAVWHYHSLTLHSFSSINRKTCGLSSIFHYVYRSGNYFI